MGTLSQSQAQPEQARTVAVLFLDISQQHSNRLQNDFRASFSGHLGSEKGNPNAGCAVELGSALESLRKAFTP